MKNEFPSECRIRIIYKIQLLLFPLAFFLMNVRFTNISRNIKKKKKHTHTHHLPILIKLLWREFSEARSNDVMKCCMKQIRVFASEILSLPGQHVLYINFHLRLNIYREVRNILSLKCASQIISNFMLLQV